MKGAKVVRLPALRRALPSLLPYAVQAEPGAVALVVPRLADGRTGHQLTPDQAYELGLDLLGAARDAARQGRRLRG